MWIFILVIFVLLIIAGILTIIGILIYSIPEALGYPRIAKWLMWIYIVLVSVLILKTIFEDELFSKNDAVKLLAEQNIRLDDDFELVRNYSEWIPGDYYHTFTLRISAHDWQCIIQEIKSAPNFKAKGDSLVNLRIKAIKIREGSEETQDSEDTESFVRELFKPNGTKYAPTYRRIIIDKKEKILKFEDIDF